MTPAASIRRSGRRALLVFALAFLLGLAAAAPSRAAYDPLGSGVTRLSLDRSFLSSMRENGIKLTAVAPAAMRAGTVTFPVSGGKFDPLSGKGTVEHEGALLFQSGRRKIPPRTWSVLRSPKRTPSLP